LFVYATSDVSYMCLISVQLETNKGPLETIRSEKETQLASLCVPSVTISQSDILLVQVRTCEHCYRFK